MGRRAKGEHDENTRGLIQDASIQLISDLGYRGATIRAIAEKAGIKESTVYYYFKSKKAIFDAIFDRCASELLAVLPPIDQLYGIISRMPLEEFLLNGLRQYLDGLRKEGTARVIRILLGELFREKRATEMLMSYFEQPVKFLETAFKLMIEKGSIPPCDALLMAREYQFPILSLSIQFMACDQHGMDRQAIEKMLEDHVRFFCTLLKGGSA